MEKDSEFAVFFRSMATLPSFLEMIAGLEKEPPLRLVVNRGPTRYRSWKIEVL